MKSVKSKAVQCKLDSERLSQGNDLKKEGKKQHYQSFSSHSEIGHVPRI